MTRGGGGVKIPRKTSDVINERPLIKYNKDGFVNTYNVEWKFFVMFFFTFSALSRLVNRGHIFVDAVTDIQSKY